MSRLEAVLLWDLADSTPIRAELSQPVFEREFITPLRRLIREVAERHGGTTFGESNQGDGGWASFASANGALSASVDIQRRAHRHVVRGIGTDLRIALAVSDVHDDEAGSPTGFALVIAARLEALAKDHIDQKSVILCQDVVKVLAHGWDRTETRYLGQFELKGVPGSTGVHEIDWSRSPLADTLGMPEAFDSRWDTDFVGRLHELADLRARWDSLPSDGPSAVLIEGPAGYGKTRLCAELASVVRADGGAVLYGRCDERVPAPFQPFSTALRAFLGASPNVEKDLGPAASELSRIVPELSDMIPGLRPPTPSDTTTERHRLFRAVADWLATITADTPTMLVLDDLTWAQDETLDLLASLDDNLPSCPLLIIGTQRSEMPDGEAAGEPRRRPLSDVIELPGLDDRAVVELAEAVLGEKLDAETQGAVQTLGSIADGNPLFIEEILRHPGEGGIGALHSDRGPHSFEHAVRQRLTTMDDRSRKVLATAAVAGVEIEREVVYRVHSEDLTRDDVTRALAAAERASLLRVQSPERLEFTHALLRDIVHDVLNTSDVERLELHRKIATAIEAIHTPALDAYFEELALHFDQAGDRTERVLGYYRAAAAKAESSLAHTQAARLLGRAVELSDGADHQTRSELGIALGQAQKRAGVGSYRDILDRAYDQAMKVEDERTQWELAKTALLADSRGIFHYVGHVDETQVARLKATIESAPADAAEESALLQAHLAVELSFSDDREERESYARNALRLARTTNDDETIARTLVKYMVTMWHPDGISNRMEAGRELLQRCERIDRPGMRVNAITAYFQACMEAGEFEIAENLLAELTGLADDLRQPTTLGFARLRQSTWAAMKGELDDASLFARQFLDAAIEARQPDALAFYAGMEFVVHLHRRELAANLAELRAAADEYPQILAFRAGLASALASIGEDDACATEHERVMSGIGELRLDLNWLVAHVLTCMSCRHLGDKVGAGLLLDTLEPYRHRYVDIGTGFYGSVEHYLGMLHATVGDAERARLSLGRATDDYDRIGAVPWSTRVRIDTAHAQADIGDLDGARHSLDQALELAREHELVGLQSWAASEVDDLWMRRSDPQ